MFMGIPTVQVIIPQPKGSGNLFFFFSVSPDLFLYSTTNSILTSLTEAAPTLWTRQYAHDSGLASRNITLAWSQWLVQG